MHFMFRAAGAAAIAATGLSGCGTITQGTTQNIAITSSPPGAQCDLDRGDGHVTTLYRTPGTVHVDKSKYDIMLTCTKRGYQPVTSVLESGYGIGVFGNVLIGGAVGVAIDFATGAANHYPNASAVQLIPLKDDLPSKNDPVPFMQAASRPPCTQEDWEIARLAEESHFRARMACD